MEVPQNRAPAVRWRSVALPTEHGAWAFVLEPLLLGLLLAPAWGGLALAIATLGAFLLRQPLKLYLKDVQNKRRVPRMVTARRFILLYGGSMGIAALVALVFMPSPVVLVPLLLALPLFGLQLSYDLHSQSRSMAAEMAGAVATGALAASMVMMQNWALLPALGLWVVMAAKATTAIYYVRARLRLERQQPVNRNAVVAVHAVATCALLLTAATGWIRWTAPLALGLLTLRAAVGLSSLRTPRAPKVIGTQEVMYGLGYVLLVVLGYKLG